MSDREWPDVGDFRASAYVARDPIGDLCVVFPIGDDLVHIPPQIVRRLIATFVECLIELEIERDREQREST